jgi:hypothetical protein|tara:strand:- start:304 stop:1668 length:1365 start_codon:yes stop_codon:yes gene_type:complete
MATTLELKYFNTFWIKKIKSVVAANPQPTAPYNNVPRGYSGVNADDWYIEESRIRGGYNNTTVDFGVKAYIAEDNPQQQNRINTMIYSGIFNSRTGVNNTNQFSVAEEITRSVDPANGSIQLLYAEDTNLIIFQEDKVSRALIDKDAIYSAEGSALTTSGRLVIGQIVPYAGEYGISKDPSSFAVYGYRKYFTDRKRNTVLRLTTNGAMVEISSYGMHDFFRDKLSALGTTRQNRIIGGFDIHTKNYVLSIQNQDNSYITSNFDEDVQGWTSFYTYKPTYMLSLNSSFYSFYDGKLWLHHVQPEEGVTGYGNYYGTVTDSTVKVILNSQPSVVKNFKTINYEGATGWQLDSMIASSSDATLPINAYVAATSIDQLEQQIFSLNFKKKENKFFANLQQDLTGNITPQPGEVLWGSDISGIKGFWSTVVMKLNNTTYYNIKKELFAVSSNAVESSY